jgi:hypothetical protein
MLRYLVAALWIVLTNGGALQQAPDPIQFSASPTTVKPGDVVTLTWEVPDSFQDLDHVTIEMHHPRLDLITFGDLPPAGTLDVTIPSDYYDVAQFSLYPQMTGDSYYRDAEGYYISADLEVVVDDGVAVTKFRADPNVTDRGNGVLISWEVSGLDPDTESVFLWYYGNDGIFERTDDLPTVGTIVLEPPTYYTESFSVFLAAEKVWSGNSLEIGIRCPYGEFLAPVCPFTHEEETLRYQLFEHGMMLLWGERVLIVHDDGYFYERDPQAYEPFDLDLTPPEGLYSPAPEFVTVWSIGGLDFSMGWALGDVTSYSTVFETIPDTAGRYNVTGYFFYLPSSELIHANPTRMVWWEVE